MCAFRGELLGEDASALMKIVSGLLQRFISGDVL
jgi:uncharacterized membrane protein